MDYRITLRALSEEEGGGWLAEIPELPGCMSDGETTQEALENLQDAKETWLEMAKETNMRIPEPSNIDSYSGKFLLRIPKSLHRHLTLEAEREGTSLNQYIVYLLSNRHVMTLFNESASSEGHVKLRNYIELLVPKESWEAALKTEKPDIYSIFTERMKTRV